MQSDSVAKFEISLRLGILQGIKWPWATGQVPYNIVDQDHLAIKRMTRPMLGFKTFWSASITLAGIKLMHMICKGQLKGSGQ